MKVVLKQHEKHGPWYWGIWTNNGSWVPGLMRYTNKKSAWRASRNFIKRNQRLVYSY